MLVTWGVLFVLSAVEGTLTSDALEPAFLHDPVPYVRLLVALPLLMIAGSIIDPATRAVFGYLDQAGIVPAAECGEYERAIAQLTRRRDARWVDVALLVLALAFSSWLALAGDIELREGAAADWVERAPGSRALTLAGGWYFLFCLPLFQIAVLRWLYRFAIWIAFLARLSRLKLALQPTHPDQAGGLGIVAVGQNAFVVIFVAFGAVVSSLIARDIFLGQASLAESKHVAVGYIVLGVLVLLLPLALFAKVLVKTKRRGLLRYGPLAQELSATFANRWIDGEAHDPEKLIDTGDPSAVADYGAEYDTVRRMHVLLASPRSAMTLAAALFVPFVPLILTESSVKDLLRRLSGILM